jgi:hypothetical protein
VLTIQLPSAYFYDDRTAWTSCAGLLPGAQADGRLEYSGGDGRGRSEQTLRLPPPAAAAPDPRDAPQSVPCSRAMPVGNPGWQRPCHQRRELGRATRAATASVTADRLRAGSRPQPFDAAKPWLAQYRCPHATQTARYAVDSYIGVCSRLCGWQTPRRQQQTWHHASFNPWWYGGVGLEQNTTHCKPSTYIKAGSSCSTYRRRGYEPVHRWRCSAVRVLQPTCG